VLVPRKDRFDKTADNYVRFRPGYPSSLVDWLLAATGLHAPGCIVDVGCGTGISTRTFAGRGFELVGIDPSEAMLERARREGGADFRRGDATATGLPDQSAHLAIAGQAFHWFELGPTLVELRRILVPSGWCCAFWNLRGKTPFLDEYDQLLRAQSTEYEQVPKPLPTIAAIKAHASVTSVHEGELPNRQELDLDGLVGRAFSSSYIAHGVTDRPKFERALADLFARHAVAGKVEFVYRTVAIAWQVR
jgi:SAM-dependent methyltransferase